MAIETKHDLPGNIFTQPWWLDIVAPGRWKDITLENNGEITARMPIVLNKKKGLVFIEMPKLTQKLGPWIKNEADKQESIHSTERTILEELIGKIPYFDSFNYNMDLGIVNYLPFTWSGFSQNSLTTFQIKSPIDLDNVWDNLKGTVRRHVRRSEEKLEIDQETSVDELYGMIQNTFSRQGMNVPYSKNLLADLFKEASSRNRATIHGAKDENGKLHAAHIFIHDDEISYYLAGGFDPDSNISGAVSFVLWSGIKEAHKRGNTFDFEGSSIKSIEKYFSSFGAVPVHFHQIKGISKKYAPIYYTKQFFQKMKGDD